MQRSFLYYPQPSYPPNGADKLTFQNQQQKLTGWLVNPGKDKLLFYYGGNAEPVEMNAEFFEAMLPDWSVLLMPYRGYGVNPGSPTEEGLYSDALFIYDQIADNYQKTALMGRSLGSGVATYVASKRDNNGTILITPYDSIVNVAKEHYRFFPVSWLVKDKYDSISRAPLINKPVLMLIAANDNIIAPRRSEALAEAFPADRLLKKVIVNTDHNNIGASAEYIQSIKSFLDNIK
ncbi:alpha/beta hydrolase [Aliikangiella marina]|nr:alpha/beta hydrolase [Aliikangiella marina]